MKKRILLCVLLVAVTAAAVAVGFEGLAGRATDTGDTCLAGSDNGQGEEATGSDNGQGEEAAGSDSGQGVEATGSDNGQGVEATGNDNGQVVEATGSDNRQNIEATAENEKEMGNVGGLTELEKVYLQNYEVTGNEQFELCELYLQVLEDLWKDDTGLNENIVYISVDLSEAPGELSDNEKVAIALVFAQRHDAEPLGLTYAELAESGYLTQVSEASEGREPLWQWDDGVLFKISSDAQEKQKTLKFDAMKWRSPLGAYYFMDCTAKQGRDGAYSYEVGGWAIS